MQATAVRTTPAPVRPTRTTATPRAALDGSPEPVRHTRLTRRGRLLVVLVLVMVMMAAFSLGRVASQAAPVGGAEASAVSLRAETVQPGESLWTVARRIAPDNDAREVIAQIRRINRLDSPTLRVGQQLLLPVPA